MLKSMRKKKSTPRDRSSTSICRDLIPGTHTPEQIMRPRPKRSTSPFHSFAKQKVHSRSNSARGKIGSLQYTQGPFPTPVASVDGDARTLSKSLFSVRDHTHHCQKAIRGSRNEINTMKDRIDWKGGFVPRGCPGRARWGHQQEDFLAQFSPGKRTR